jgi:hypothetical protein
MPFTSTAGSRKLRYAATLGAALMLGLGAGAAQAASVTTFASQT